MRKFLTKDIIVSMNWFKQNSLKANPEKFQTMVISSHSCDIYGLMITVENTTSSTERMKVLGVKIDNKLNFTEHISDVCIKASRQLNILQCLEKLLDYKSRTVIYKLFIMSNFNYCPIVWMFTGKKIAGKNWEYSKTHLAFCAGRLHVKLSWSVIPKWSIWSYDTAFIGNWGIQMRE